MTQCHKKLFCYADTEGTSTFMSKILDKVWPSKKATPEVYIAYAKSMCEFLLNLTNKRIQVSETPMKFQIQKYLQKNINKEKFNSNDSNDDGVSSEKQQECGGDKIIQIGEEKEEVKEVREVLEEKVEEKKGSDIEDDDYYSSENEKRRALSLKRKYSKQI